MFPYTMTAHIYEVSGTFSVCKKYKFYIKIWFFLEKASIEKYAAEV